MLRMTLPTDVQMNPQKRAVAFGRYQANRLGIARAAPPTGFDFPVQLVGTTPDGNVTVYYDPTLGPGGASLAQQIFATAAQTYASSQAFFNVPGQPVNVIFAAINGATDGSGGAYHYGCNFNPGGDLYCDAAYANPQLTTGLMVAELTECFMGAQNKGWNCGASNGEALSRVLAELLSGGPNGALAAFASGPAWDQAGRPDWIDATEPTDQDLVSTGCGVVYLYWVISKGFTAAQVTQAGCPNGALASNYSALTGLATAWADFMAAVNALPGGITSDNPWGSAPPPPPPSCSPSDVIVDPVNKTVSLPSGWQVASPAGIGRGARV
jgi:hypothetical protein